MLEGQNLSFRYTTKQEWLFRNLNIPIYPGQKVGLSGPSGRGKSTLARILAGYLPSVHGRVLVDGNPHSRNIFCPVQLLFQHPERAVNPRWKIKDILNEAATPQNELLRLLGIKDSWAERYPHELSGGELQRVCLARALDHRTRYLLCDEMTSMLDALTQASIWSTVLQVAEARNIGLLVISHDTALLERVCDRSIRYFEDESEGARNIVPLQPQHVAAEKKIGLTG